MNSEGFNNNQAPNSAADQWSGLGGVNFTPSRGRGLVQGPDGNWITKEEYDAAMEAQERAEFYKNNPGAAEHEALIKHLGEMEANPDRLKNFEGEHARGAQNRLEEYTTIKDMYAGDIDDATRRDMISKMRAAEKSQREAKIAQALHGYEQNDRYADYIAREREKIGTVYKDENEFNFRVADRLRRLGEKPKTTAPDNSAEINTSAEVNEPAEPINPPETNNAADTRAEEANRLSEAERKLNELTPQWAKLRADNRRLISFFDASHKDRYDEVKKNYKKALDEYVKLKREEEKRFIENNGGWTEEAQKKYDASRLTHYFAQAKKLEAATIESLDNGGLMKQFVGKVLGNSIIRKTLATCAATGLAIAGIRIATGSPIGDAVGLGFAGAAVGAFAGSRANRPNSTEVPATTTTTAEDTPLSPEPEPTTTPENPAPESDYEELMDEISEEISGENESTGSDSAESALGAESDVGESDTPQNEDNPESNAPQVENSAEINEQSEIDEILQELPAKLERVPLENKWKFIHSALETIPPEYNERRVALERAIMNKITQDEQRWQGSLLSILPQINSPEDRWNYLNMVLDSVSPEEKRKIETGLAEAVL